MPGLAPFALHPIPATAWSIQSQHSARELRFFPELAQRRHSPSPFCPKGILTQAQHSISTSRPVPAMLSHDSSDAAAEILCSSSGTTLREIERNHLLRSHRAAILFLQKSA